MTKKPSPLRRWLIAAATAAAGAVAGWTYRGRILEFWRGASTTQPSPQRP